MKSKSGFALILMLAMFCGSALAESRKVVKEKTPVYPAIARTMQLHGSVTLQVTVSNTGKVVETKVVGGHPVLAQSAVDAVSSWVFEPAPGTTVETIKVNFGE